MKKIKINAGKRINLKRVNVQVFFSFSIGCFNNMQISYKLKLIAAIGLGVVFSFQNSLRAQDLKLRPKNKTYWQEVQADSLKQMIELKSLVPGIVYDLR